MNITFDVLHVSEVVRDYIIPCLTKYQVLALLGPLGAGKTTLVKELLHQCGVKQTITSPTFNYVNTYHDDQGRTFHHFDLYRIKTMDDFFNAGFDEYFQQKNTWVFVEWPEVINAFLKSRSEVVCYITLNYLQQSPDLRNLKLCEPMLERNST